MYSGSWGDLEGIIKCQMEEAPHYDLGAKMEPRKEAVAFNKPTKGTSMEKFKEMVLSHLKVRVQSFLLHLISCVHFEFLSNNLTHSVL